MKTINKVVRKIQNEGFCKLFSSLKDFAFRKASKTAFKIKAYVKFKVFRNHQGLQFKSMPLNLNYQHLFELKSSELISLATHKKFQILSDNYDNYSSERGKVLWNVDPVYNCFWPMDKWGVDISIGYNQGDIKRPWELGRLHILVELALRYKTETDETIKEKLYKSAEDLLKDFSNSNDFFYGPQWMCAMDVGIRIANICIAADVFGEEFQRNNNSLLRFELARHLFFIENNLEFKNRSFVNNHFLGNLAGLVILLTHTEKSNGTKQKLMKYSLELVNQLNIQFMEDGGNFEGSTYYHRLSCELVLFPLASVLSFNKRIFSKNHIEIIRNKFKKIHEFTKAIQDYEGIVPQIGDNDSGHLFIFDSHRFELDDQNFSIITSVIEAFVDNIDADNINEIVIDKFLNGSKSSGKTYIETETSLSDEASQKVFNKYISDLNLKKNKQQYLFTFNEINPENLSVAFFPLFGLVIFKSEGFFLSIRSGQAARDTVGGHRHIDQLSFFLKTPDISTPRDPGSYCYTSDTKTRNILRSANVHHIPHVERDCSLSNLDLFEMNKYGGECLYLSKNNFLGKFSGDIDTYFRAITITRNQLEVTDWSEKDLVLKRLDFKERYFSSRYGVWCEVK